MRIPNYTFYKQLNKIGKSIIISWLKYERKILDELKKGLIKYISGSLKTKVQYII